jgi:MFS family permease
MEAPAALDEEGRPSEVLPVGQLIRLSLYWLGLSSIWSAVDLILSGRLQFGGLVPKGSEATTLFELTVGGAIVAILVQPTIGTISDYTISRWGRRKPYIFIGSLLDLAFLFALGVSNSLLALALLYILLQFSSNFAQGPFQGYVPDLVPSEQVGLASGLVGMMQVLGNVAGFLIGSLAVGSGSYLLGLVAVGGLEVVTMLSVVVRVREGRAAKPRAGRPWRSIALDAWGTDILRERSFVFLVLSRLFVLMGGAALVKLALFYLAQTFGLDEGETSRTLIVVLAIVTVANLIAVIPASRLSDRVGRKAVIYVACALGAVSMAIIAVAPSIPVAFVAVAFFGMSQGTFLSVDWALMTDIIPKAAAGRFMGISNLATASAGIFAIMIGGTLSDFVNRTSGYGQGPRVAYALAVVSFVLGAVFLRGVREPRPSRSEALEATAVA